MSWTAEARAKAAARARQHKPWQYTTGPRTEAGKATSAQNACQHGNRDATIRELLSLLAAFRRRVSALG